MHTLFAKLVLVHVPLQVLARASATEIGCERLDFQKPDQRKELSDSVLERRAAEAPTMIGLQGKASLGSASGARLNLDTIRNQHPFSSLVHEIGL